MAAPNFSRLPPTPPSPLSRGQDCFEAHSDGAATLRWLGLASLPAGVLAAALEPGAAVYQRYGKQPPLPLPPPRVDRVGAAAAAAGGGAEDDLATVLSFSESLQTLSAMLDPTNSTVTLRE
jgi:hypothetical protein